MNRKERRAILKQSGKAAQRSTASESALAPTIEDLHETALLHRKKGELLEAQTMCRAILARDPKHVGALIIMGGTSQEQGRNQAAIKYLKEALALDNRSAQTHDNLALTYQSLGRHDDAVAHFSQAIALGLGNVETLIKHDAAVSTPLHALMTAWPRQLSLAELFGPDGMRAIAQDGLLLALLQTRVVCDLELERFLTAVRSTLLQAVWSDRRAGLADGLVFFRALAQQCFINEYIYPLTDIARDQASRWCDRLAESVACGAEIAPIDVIVAALYQPLHTLPVAVELAERAWPDVMAPLLAQQIHEPMEEASDLDTIPVLTGADDAGSLENQKQFDENPYPRWVARPPARPTTLEDYLRDKLGHESRALQQ